jgi:hypothetical protein
MQIKAEEISSIIKEKIKGFDKQVDVKETRLSHPGRRWGLPDLWSRRAPWPAKCLNSPAAFTGSR